MRGLCGLEFALAGNDQAAIRKKVCLDGGYCKALWSAEQEAKARGEFGQVGASHNPGVIHC